MDNKEKKEDNYYLLFGISLVLFSSFINVLGYFYPKVNFAVQLFVSLFSNAGIILIILSLVESKHLRKSLENTSKRIVDDSAKHLEKKFDDTFAILEHSKYNGLMDILAPRLDEDRGKNTRAIIGNEIKKSKQVLIFSISGLGFFGYQHGGGVPPESDSISAIIDRIATAKKENKEIDLKIKALLMDPTCNAAIFRNKIETLAGNQGNIDADIESALRGISGLHTYAGKDFIEYYLYDTFPQANFVLTDNCVFIEPYHYAPTEEFTNALSALNLKAITQVTCCTGGRVPILQFHSKSNMYIAMKNHFETIWKACMERAGEINRNIVAD